MRLFFAVELTDEIITRVCAVQEELRSAIGEEGVRWARPEQFHLTLKFLGEVSDARVVHVVDAAMAAREGRKPFDLTIGGVGAFPTDARPSTLWVSVMSGVGALADLALALEAELQRRGFPRDRRPLKGHLTLARIKTYAGEKSAARALRSAEVGELGAMIVDRFVLMQSTLKPSGSEYALVEGFGFVSEGG